MPKTTYTEDTTSGVVQSQLDPAAEPTSSGKSGLRGLGLQAQERALSPDRSAAVQRQDATMGASTDPRLGYTDEAEEGLANRKLPYHKPGICGSPWDAPEILDHLTQVDELSGTEHDDKRCGAHAVLAVAIMAGPKAVGELVGNMADKAGKIFKKMPKGEVDLEISHLFFTCLKCQFLRHDIWRGHGTYGDLSKIAHALKMLISEVDKATSQGQIMDMGGLLGKTAKNDLDAGIWHQSNTFVEIDSDGDFQKAVKSLAPGEAWIAHVDTDVAAEGQGISNEHQNHYVTVGRTPDSKKEAYPDGIYLHDPYPRVVTTPEGTEQRRQYYTASEPGFWTLFKANENQWKSVQFITRILPKKVDPRNAKPAEENA